jgi:hypothetical protein
MIYRLFKSVVLTAFAAATVVSLPDLARYLRMRNM